MLLVLLMGCDPEAKAAKHLGEGAVCEKHHDDSAICVRGGQTFYCIVQGGKVACAPYTVPLAEGHEERK